MNNKRSNKWTFLIYKDSAPEDYINILNGLQIPYMLSPWHDKDIDRKTGDFKKAHRHGAFFFDSLKSYNQVSDLVTENLNSPKHVEIVMSTKGMYDYFTHAENEYKTTYDKEDIISGCGFDVQQFIDSQDDDKFLSQILELIEENELKEFQDLVDYAKTNNYRMLSEIIKHTYFYSKYLDSKRWRNNDDENDDEDE